MSTPLAAETHRIAAGSDFDGSIPLNTPTVTSGNLVYPEGPKGGLFKLAVKQNEDPAAKEQIREITSLRIEFGGQTSWSLSVKDSVTTWVLLQGTTEEILILTDRITIAPDEELSLITTGASTAMKVKIVYRLLDTL